MFNKIFAIIPARGGSKRLPRKNLYLYKNKPLIKWTIEAALLSKYISFDNLYVTTEDTEIKNTVQSLCQIINRPYNLATDGIWIQSVINHAVKTITLTEKVAGVAPEDIIVILQPNSPQIQASIIDKCIEKLIDNNLYQTHTVDENLIHNGAIHVLRAKICNYIGKVCYNGVVITNWLDIHCKEDIEKLP